MGNLKVSLSHIKSVANVGDYGDDLVRTFIMQNYRAADCAVSFYDSDTLVSKGR